MREIANICRKIARAVVEGENTIEIDSAMVEKFWSATLSLRNHGKQDLIGVATGLAWTEVGGDI